MHIVGNEGWGFAKSKQRKKHRGDRENLEGTPRTEAQRWRRKVQAQGEEAGCLNGKYEGDKERKRVFRSESRSVIDMSFKHAGESKAYERRDEKGWIE